MLRTLVIVALQCSRKILVFFWPTDCISLDFLRDVTRLAFSFFLSYNIFSFSPGRWFEIFLSLVPGGFFFSIFLVPWMLVDIRLVYIYIYIYIYIYWPNYYAFNARKNKTNPFIYNKSHSINDNSKNLYLENKNKNYHFLRNTSKNHFRQKEQEEKNNIKNESNIKPKIINFTHSLNKYPIKLT